MAVLTTILSPDPVALSNYRFVVDSMAARILPPGHDSEKDIRVSEEQGLLIAVLGRPDHIVTRGLSILAGVTVVPREEAPWWRLSGPVPDGTFALFRTDGSAMEAVTDYTGSKTIWHARLECGGVVTSTCMELIVGLLGSFAVDDVALGWFLSSGTSGPQRSWDTRIKPLPPNSLLRAEKEGSAITVRQTPLERDPPSVENVDYAGLENALSQTLLNSSFGDKSWLLALSGGCDSRAILHYTRHVEDLTCVTWVDEHLVDQPDSDLAIVRLLAKATGRKHLVKVIKRPENAVQLDQALRRFVQYCDGRVDNYLAYVDGMRIWDELGSSEAGGLLRGDELFGSAVATKTPQILDNMRLISFVDYVPDSEQRDLAILHNHTTPASLLKGSKERAERWRWRLRADHEISTVYAALNSIRARFMEVSCPLLTGSLVRLAGSMSIKSLDDKALFRKVVGRMYPDIPFASRSSILRRSDVQAIPEAIELVLEHLGTAFASEVLGGRCAGKVSEALTKLNNESLKQTDSHGVVAGKKSIAPVWMKRIKRRFDAPPVLHLPSLGMRSYLAKLVCEEMTDAANLGARSRNRDNCATA